MKEKGGSARTSANHFEERYGNRLSEAPAKQMRYPPDMSDLTAHDLWPLILKLTHEERVRLAKLALRAAAQGADDGDAYQVSPPTEDELGTDEEPLAWEAEGWEGFHAPG